ncbi:MAG: hypothetical protein K5644_01815 [Lachnospiraceae bacterium]|nr:hypothetical protein [Lachnospiraceae bacterium]
MSIMQTYKRCPICKRKYPFNPDIGKMWCPHCGPASMPGAGDIPWEGEEEAPWKELGDIFKPKKKK